MSNTPGNPWDRGGMDRVTAIACLRCVIV